MKCDRTCGPDLSWHRSENEGFSHNYIILYHIIYIYYYIIYWIFGNDLCGENDIPARLGWFRGTWLSFHDIFLAGPWISWRSPIESPSIRLQSPILAVGENWILQNWLVKACQNMSTNQVASKIYYKQIANIANISGLHRIHWPITTSPRPGGCEAHQSWSADARWGTPHKRHLTKNTGIVMGVSWDIHRDIMGKPSIESNDLINLIWMNGKSWPKLSFSGTGKMVNV